jgi:mono/diheme cytochrome c family protein
MDLISLSQARRHGAGGHERRQRIIAIGTLITWVATFGEAHAADRAAGQRIFESSCTACHPLKAYAGKSDADLQLALQGVVAGTRSHPKKLTLSAADIANVAAYISSSQAK